MGTAAPPPQPEAKGQRWPAVWGCQSLECTEQVAALACRGYFCFRPWPLGTVRSPRPHLDFGHQPQGCPLTQKLPR